MKTIILSLFVLLLMASCQESDTKPNPNSSGEDAVEYTCKNVNVTVAYHGETVRLMYTNEENQDIDVTLQEEQTAQGQLWTDGQHSVTLIGESIQINRPLHSILKCIPKIDVEVKRPDSENPKENLVEWRSLSNYLDEVTYYEDPVKIFQDRNNAIKGLEPVQVWYFQDKPIKVFVPDVGDVGKGKGDYYYYIDGTLAYGRLLNSYMLFNKDGRLIHWLDKNENEYKLDHTDLQGKEAALREDLDKYLKMAKTFR